MVHLVESNLSKVDKSKPQIKKRRTPKWADVPRFFSMAFMC
jgi:hypothetical protein